MVFSLWRGAMAVAMIATGAVSMLAPRTVVAFTGSNRWEEGGSAIRAVPGGLFIALGGRPLRPAQRGGLPHARIRLPGGGGDPHRLDPGRPAQARLSWTHMGRWSER